MNAVIPRGITMKHIIAIALAAAFAAPALADQYVKGYTKNDGTYVAPHYRSSPDSQQWNNYNTQGNTNPYTGQRGTQADTSNGQYAPAPTPYHLRRSGY